jgi:FtsH-binding integral membrane protein
VNVIDRRTEGQPSEDESRPLQFRLATLLKIVAVLCLLLGSLKSFGPLFALAVLLLMLTLFAHVAGNAMGTRLRQEGNRTAQQSPDRISIDTSQHVGIGTPLGKRASLGRGMILVTILGVVSGAILGGTLLAWTHSNQLTFFSLTLGVFASGVIGGLSGFLAGSFLSVLAQVVLQVQKEPSVRHRL